MTSLAQDIPLAESSLRIAILPLILLKINESGSHLLTRHHLNLLSLNYGLVPFDSMPGGHPSS